MSFPKGQYGKTDNNNIFNKSILGDDAFYFKTSKDIISLLEQEDLCSKKEIFALANLKKIDELYNWSTINAQYENFILEKINI